jgi:hypothetical protein
VAQCLDIPCTNALVQIIQNGDCGYGRDSSLSFASNGLVYVSFMNYSPFAIKRKVSLAVLQQQKNTTGEKGTYYSRDLEYRKNMYATELEFGSRNTDDICKFSYLLPPSF